MAHARLRGFMAVLAFVESLPKSFMKDQLMDVLADNSQDILRGNDDDVD